LTDRRFGGIIIIDAGGGAGGGISAVYARYPHALFLNPRPVCDKDVFYGEGKMAKGMRALIIAGAIVCITATLSAEVYFENEAYPGGHFVDALDVYSGDNYWYVDADETSVVDIFGGTVDELAPFGSSTANISGGLTEALNASETSIVNISGGEVVQLLAVGLSTISVTGGVVDWLSVSYNSEATISEAEVTNLWAQGSSVVDIIGYELSFDPHFYWDSIRQVWQGSLTGYWQDKSPFSITTWDEPTYDHLALNNLGPLPGIPEPATLLLLGLGGLVLRRKV
jgi:hypothetical protein